MHCLVNFRMVCWNNDLVSINKMSGGSYHISFQQILKSEKKLRLYSATKIGAENINIRKLCDKDIEEAGMSNVLKYNFSILERKN